MGWSPFKPCPSGPKWCLLFQCFTDNLLLCCVFATRLLGMSAKQQTSTVKSQTGGANLGAGSSSCVKPSSCSIIAFVAGLSSSAALTGRGLPPTHHVACTSFDVP